MGKFGPYFTDHHSTPWGDVINFEFAGLDRGAPLPDR